MISFYAVELVATLQHAIELVDQHGNRLVALTPLDGGIHVRAVNLDVAFGRELDAGRGAAITLQFHAHPYDAFLVAKQSRGLLMNERLKRGRQFKVNAGDD
jgi:hypothetical protein